MSRATLLNPHQTKDDVANRVKTNRFGDLARPLSLVQYPLANWSGGVVPVINTTAPTGTVLNDWAGGGFHYTARASQYAAGYALFQGSPVTFLPTTSIETTFSGTQLHLRLLPLNVNQTVQVYVDNQPVFTTPQTVTASTIPYIHMVWAARGTRNVRAMISGTCLFGGGYAPLYETVAQPARRFRVGMYGDSYFGRNNDVTLESLAYYLTLLTGWDIYQMDQGGTGFINTAAGAGGKTAYSDPGRMAYMNEFDLDACINDGGYNDAGSPTVVGGAASKFYADCQTLRPNMPVVALGCVPAIQAGGSYITALTGVNAAVRDAANAAPNVVKFIDWAVEDWLTGNGRVGATAGNGNQDWYVGTDGLHPNIEGSQFLAGRLWAAMSDAPFVKAAA